MILTLVEGSPDKSVLKYLRKFLNYKRLLEHTNIIYEKIIKPQKESMVTASKISAIDAIIIETGVNIIILHLKVFPKVKITTDAYEDYYYLNIGSVEIRKEGAIEHHYFKVPAKCHLLTSLSKKEILSSTA